MSRLFSALLLLICILSDIRAVGGQADDITLMGSVLPLYQLKNAFRETVKTSSEETLSVEISDIAVTNDQILIRFFVTGLDTSWKGKITDDNRLYGFYLPIAEIVLNNGTILTPVSASKYSFLEYNGQLIIGGLLIFDSDQISPAFYFNFNQIPFDTQPLSEGFTKTVILEKFTGTPYQSDVFSGDTKNDIEFTLISAAQTTAHTMVQPAVRMLRSDEIFSKFGWISIFEAETGKRYAATRGNLYGFNLNDDSLYFPGHAYVFSAMNSGDPLQISMDHAYVVRTYSPAKDFILDLTQKSENHIVLDDDFQLIVRDIDLRPEENRMRLYIESGAQQIADISFVFPDLSYVINPSVNCGFETGSSKFACDIFLDEISYPIGTLSLKIDAIEYKQEGPWSFTWTPVPMGKIENSDIPQDSDISSPFTYQYPISKTQPKDVKVVLEKLSQLDDQLTASNGWIHESYELDYQFSDDYTHELIPVDQFANFYTHYISDSYYYITDGKVIQKIILVRDPINGNIISAQKELPVSSLDLIHALLARVTQPFERFQAFTDFRSLAESSAIYQPNEPCSKNNTGLQCLVFYQSLSGMPNSTNSQKISFQFDSGRNMIISQQISYDLGALELSKTTLALERCESLPEDVNLLLDSIK